MADGLDTPSLHSGTCHPRPTSVSIKSGWQDSNLRLRAPKARGFAATLHPVVVFNQEDGGNCRNGVSILRNPSPTIPSAPFCALCDPYRSRTGLFAVKGRRPRTDRRTGLASAHIFHAVDSWIFCAPFTQWAGRCSNPRLRLFRPPLFHLSYRPNENQQKKPDVLMTPGFRYSQFVRPSVTCAMDNRRAYSPDDRRTVLSISIVL